MFAISNFFNKFSMFLEKLCFFIIGCATVIATIQTDIVYGSSHVDFKKNFYTYEQLLKDVHNLEQRYANTLTVNHIGYSHFGRKIVVVKLGKGDKQLLMIGAHHGREWLSTMIMMKMLEIYANAYEKKEKFEGYDSKIFDEISIWFVPMLNPDGVTIQQGDIDQFPIKHRGAIIQMNEGWFDFSRWKANGVGIDLNRQYEAGWEKLNHQPATPYYQFYRGKKPLEAKEVKALVQFTKEKQPQLAVAYHTAGREIYWDYKNGRHKKRDRFIAQKIAKQTGYRLATPDKNAIGGDIQIGLSLHLNDQDSQLN